MLARVGFAAVAAVALIAPVGASAKPATHSPSVAHDWSRTVTLTPAGGFRMGNPEAKIQIVEYGSLTCPHCRHFAETAMKPLVANYVRTGKASYEYRSMILNGVDLAATLIARCGGPARFFPMAEHFYATQPLWTARVDAMSEEEREKLQSLSESEVTLSIAKTAGLIATAAANGIPPAKAEACATDPIASMTLAKMYQAAMDRGIKGTPAIFINGKQEPIYDWATLAPFLKRGGA